MSDKMIPIQDETLEAALFEQFEDEEDAWYFRFFDFYVKLGRARTLRYAYLLHNEWATKLDKDIVKPSYDKWKEQARLFRWKKRAQSYDMEADLEAAKMVEEARTRLMKASVKAVDALELSLKNSRTRVSGAKAILDRGGLPAVSEVRKTVEPFRADELAQANEEIEAWENQMQGSNG
jgi:hypothetical protein